MNKYVFRCLFMVYLRFSFLNWDGVIPEKKKRDRPENESRIL